MPTDDKPMDALWKKYEFLDGLYRFYLEQIIDFHKFYLPIVGGVVVYVLGNPSEAIALGLAVPLIVSLGATVIFGAGVGKAQQLNQTIAESAAELGMLATHAGMLVRATAVFLLLHIVIVLGLVALIGALQHDWNLPGISMSTCVRPTP
jgi:hypothetical protein